MKIALLTWEDRYLSNKEFKQKIKKLHGEGYKILADFKLNDIPHINEKVIKQLKKWDIDMVTVWDGEKFIIREIK